jgi:hypothetical protein
MSTTFSLDITPTTFWQYRYVNRSGFDNKKASRFVPGCSAPPPRKRHPSDAWKQLDTSTPEASHSRVGFMSKASRITRAIKFDLTQDELAAAITGEGLRTCKQEINKSTHRRNITIQDEEEQVKSGYKIFKSKILEECFDDLVEYFAENASNSKMKRFAMKLGRSRHARRPLIARSIFKEREESKCIFYAYLKDFLYQAYVKHIPQDTFLQDFGALLQNEPLKDNDKSKSVSDTPFMRSKSLFDFWFYIDGYTKRKNDHAMQYYRISKKTLCNVVVITRDY